MRSCIVLSALMAVSSPTFLNAQTPGQPAKPTTQKPASTAFPPLPKWYVNFHAGAHLGSADLSRTSDFTLYEEQATFQTNHKADGGFLLDVGGAGRLYRDKYGIGVSYAAFQSSSDSSFQASLPHPLLFDQPRSVNGSAPTDHNERALHVQALWFVPYTDKIDFTVGAGPSFFWVDQGFVRSFSFSENPPDYASVTVDSVDVVEVSASAVGFNIGATMTYEIARRYGANIGADVMLRYSFGSLTFNLGEGQEAHAHAGGFQFGAGIGVRF